MKLQQQRKLNVIVRRWALLVIFAVSMIPLQVVAEPECKATDGLEVLPYELSDSEGLRFQISKRLGKSRGQTRRGQDVLVDPERGNCLSCHQVSMLEKLADSENPDAKLRFGYQGTVGGTLDGVGNKYSIGELRLILVDPKQAFPDRDIAMPSYHNKDNLVDVTPTCQGRPLLSGRDIEDIVAYLSGLKEEIKKP